MKQNIRGYLQLDVPSLLEKGVIVQVNLEELKMLMPKSHIVLIESNDGQTIEFKLVYRETKFSVCGSDKVLQEHILLNFEISQKKIKSQFSQKEEEIRREYEQDKE